MNKILPYYQTFLSSCFQKWIPGNFLAIDFLLNRAALPKRFAMMRCIYLVSTTSGYKIAQKFSLFTILDSHHDLFFNVELVKQDIFVNCYNTSLNTIQSIKTDDLFTAFNYIALLFGGDFWVKDNWCNAVDLARRNIYPKGEDLILQIPKIPIHSISCTEAKLLAWKSGFDGKNYICVIKNTDYTFVIISGGEIYECIYTTKQFLIRNVLTKKTELYLKTSEFSEPHFTLQETILSKLALHANTFLPTSLGKMLAEITHYHEKFKDL